MIANRPISQLPYPTKLSTKKGLEEFRKEIKEEENLKEDNYMLKIKFLIYIKLIFHLWTIEDYKKFKNIFIKMDTLQMKILGSSIVKCLESSKFTIFEELNLFINKVNWYIKEEKEINETDCFNILEILIRRMNKYIYNYSLNLYEELDEFNDINEEIKKINFNIFYKNFETEFGFLKNYSLFIDVYNNTKENSSKKIIDCIYMINRNNNIRKESKMKYRNNSYDALTRAPVRVYKKKFNDRIK